MAPCRRHCGSLSDRAQRLEDLGVGVARVWSLPDSLQRCIRPPQRPPEGVERLRWVGRAANEAATIMLQHEPEPAGARLQQLAAHYAVAFSMTQQEFVKATVLAREQLIAMADALDLRVDKGSPAARLLAPPGLVVDDKVQGQLRTLRNQLVLAFRQAD